MKCQSIKVTAKDLTPANSRALSTITSVLRTETSPLTFPRIRFPTLQGYTPAMYREMVKFLEGKSVEVLIWNNAPGEVVAAYSNDSAKGENKDKLLISSKYSGLETVKAKSSIIHEVTHMIQDYNQWKMSEVEREVDAHFAQAIYLYSKKANNNRFSQSSDFIDFDKAVNYFLSGKKLAYRSMKSKIKHEIERRYVQRRVAVECIDKYDFKRIDVLKMDMNKRIRLDGF